MNLLATWLHGNKLSLKFVKTQSLIFTSRPNIQKIEKETEAKPSFEIDDKEINMISYCSPQKSFQGLFLLFK